MTPYKKLATIIVYATLVSQSVAQPTSFFPRGCEVKGFGFSEDYLILNESGNQSFYLIQNKSKIQLELEHYENQPDTFMSPKLECKISSNRWASFASDVRNTYFSCFAYEGNRRIPVKCSDVLEVCQYPRVKFALSNMGNYWVSTNKSQYQVVKDSIDKGIFLRW